MKNRILSAILALAMVTAMIPSALAESVTEPDKAAQIDGTQYDTLALAIEAAEDGDTITLLKDVTGFTNEPLTGDKNAPVFLLNKDITLDGDGHKLEAGTFTTTRNPILAVQNDGEGAGVKVTIRDLTVVGNADTGHGINVWSQATGEQRPTLTLENVTIRDCGTAAIVVNNAVVTADGLTTSGNAWGAVNVDDAESLFTLTSGQLDEAAQIWTEAQPAGEQPDNIQVPEDWKYVAVNKDGGEGQADVKYHLTTDPTKLGQAHNETTNTVYDLALRALEGAESGQTVSVIRSAQLASAATVKAGVRLVVREDVTLSGELTNQGTVENRGTLSGQVINEGAVENHGTLSGALTNHGTVDNSGAIVGTVEGSGTVEGDGQQLSVITFETTPEDAVVTVVNHADEEMEPAQDKIYHLADGSYTYEVSAQGYVTKTGAFEVASAPQTIQAELELDEGEDGDEDEDHPPVEPGDPAYAVTVDGSQGGSVTADPVKAAQGQSVKLTVQAQEGYELKELTVTGPAGAVELTEQGQGVYAFVMPAGDVTVSAVFAQIEEEPTWTNPYDDVSEGAWYFDYVAYVSQAGLMEGTGNGDFAPSALSSRGTFVTILARLAGVDTEGGQTWYEKAMAWAVEEQISDGTAPESFITREQAVTMLYRYAGSPAVEGDHLAKFQDADAVSDWAVEAMNWAVSVGMIQGGDAGLAPQHGAIRVELAAMFARFDALTA